MKLNHSTSFSYFRNVESFYETHSDIFNSLIGKISDDFNISHNILKDTIKRALAEILADGPKDYLHVKKVPLKSKLMYFVVMFLFLINSIFSKKIKTSRHKKFIFDGMNISVFNYFYKSLVNLIAKDDVLLFISFHHKSYKKIDYELEKIYSYKYIYDSKISKNIFLTQFSSLGFYCKLSAQLDLNLVHIALSIFRKIAIHTTSAKKFEGFVFFSAADNYFDSLRYDIYKKNGIQNIALLQNGLRTGEWANDSVDLYSYCDYYFGFGKEQINIQKGMKCKNKIPLGSLKLDLMLKTYQNFEKKEKFDFVFLASFEESDTPYIKVKTYETILENLCTFKKNNPSLSIYYSDKKREINSFKYNSMIAQLESSGIICSSKHINNSYEAILCSRAAIFYRTTVGLEAIGMGKAVLNLNYDNGMLPLSKKDSYLVLTNSSYKEFEKRLIDLLEDTDSNNGVDNKKLTNSYMNNSSYNDLPKDILDIVLSNKPEGVGMS